MSVIDDAKGDALELEAGEYRLRLRPRIGGSIACFQWRNIDLMRPAKGSSILDMSSFPLVPFCNRIAHGNFVANGRQHMLPPNMPGSNHPHPLHGFGWLAPWTVVERNGTSALLTHEHRNQDTSWSYRAEQRFTLSVEGLHIQLSVTNLAEESNRFGLGLHPYFPRDESVTYRGLHKGEWTTSAEGLPLQLDGHDEAIDWWKGRPVGSRAIDTSYVDRIGSLSIDWPDTATTLLILPSDNLSVTTVYTPAGEDYFCVEPVSHGTDSMNRDPSEMRLLGPGETMRADCWFRASERSDFP